MQWTYGILTPFIKDQTDGFEDQLRQSNRIRHPRVQDRTIAWIGASLVWSVLLAGCSIGVCQTAQRCHAIFFLPAQHSPFSFAPP
jgi:hypothetical protein